MDRYRELPVKKTVRLNPIQKAMAHGMKASLNELACSQVSRELDCSQLQQVRRMQGVSINTLFMAAVARVLVRHPLLNAQLVGDEIVIFEPVNLGMAVTTEAGLVVAVIQNANCLPIAELDQRITAVSDRLRSGKIRLEDIEGGTFTVSNLGMLAVDAGVPIPRPPEAAILLLGAVRPRPVVVAGEIAIRHTAWVTLSFDHRFIDGAAGAAFLGDLQAGIDDLETLFSDAAGEP
jgi:pyruvate dehydrogenase E2 component (dihydrolipoamide acetyltransferase)